jgi:pimeloyl-ACP methyl ester carboxylesterase
LVSQIDWSSKPVLIGYSFGGMMAIEIAKQNPAAAVILISSIKHYHERPVTMALTSGLNLNRFFPAELGRNFRFAYTWLNDPRSQEEHSFIEQMATDMDPDHTDWAINHALKWRNTSLIDAPLYHIHGEDDRIFPIRYISDCIRIRGGSHLMLLNKGPEITDHIHQILQKLPQSERRRTA